MYCIQCGEKLTVGDYPMGCPSCLHKGHPSSVTFQYEDGWTGASAGKGMKKYAAMLPYDDFPSLGEGDTPIVSVPRLAEKVGIKNLFVKCEFQNPTGSHKDRMNPLIVLRAREMKYERVAAASSGNEGVSLACYAAAAGISCSIAATETIALHWKQAITAAGAELITTADSIGRWELMRKKMSRDNWFCATNVNIPPVGSCPFGVQGYKTISYEIYEEMKDGLPDYIMIPTSRGDLLWGIYEGFKNLEDAGKIAKIPHLIAVEPFARLEKVKSLNDCAGKYEGNSEKTPSIGGNTVTVQSFLALRKSNGFAVSVPSSLAEASVCELAENGIYLETSSALPLGGLKRLVKEKKVPESASVMLIATSHGFKN